MYGNAAFTGFGPEPIRSITGLVDAIKRRQMLKAQAKLKLVLDGETFRVNYLANGYLELDGKIPSKEVEDAISHAIETIGAQLNDDVEQQ